MTGNGFWTLGDKMIRLASCFLRYALLSALLASFGTAVAAQTVVVLEAD